MVYKGEPVKHLKHAILLSLCATSASASAQGDSYIVVAAEGLQIPGSSGVTTTSIPLSQYPSWAINQNGVVAYIAFRDGPSVGDPEINRMWLFDRTTSPSTSIAYAPLVGASVGQLMSPVDLNADDDIISICLTDRVEALILLCSS